MKIAVVDDRSAFVERAATAVQNNIGVEPIPLTGDGLRQLVVDLADLQLSGSDRSPLDEYDLFILDYELKDESKTIGLTTGADIARLLRTYTLCGAIVLTNTYVGPERERRFDLRLVGDLELFSDFETASDFLDNRGLWHMDAWLPFRPSPWPALSQLPTRLEACASLLEGRVDELILDVVPDLSGHLADLTPEDLQWLGNDVTDLRVRDIGGSASVSLLAPTGRAEVPDRVLARFAASRLMKWVDQYVLIRGVGLVDAAHLIARQPAVLREAADLSNRTNLVDQLEPWVRSAAADLEPWTSRTAWWMNDLGEAPLRDLIAAKGVVGMDEVFCEDASAFFDRAIAQSYVLPVPSPYRRRWIVGDPEKLGGVRANLQPAQWLAM